MAKVIAITNQKGGVAKTTTALNLGIGLVRSGKKVLLIDNDPQASLTTALGYQKPDELPITIADILSRIINDEPYAINEGILIHKEGIFLMPSNLDLSGVENVMMNFLTPEKNLKEYVDKVRPYFDYIIIDCSPNLGMLTVNALSCADEVIIPVQAAYLPVKGLELLLKTISKVKRKVNNDLKIRGILITMVDKRTTYARDVIDLVEQVYGSELHIFDTEIPFTVRAAEAPALGISIYEHDPKGKAAEAYRKLTEEVLA